MDKENEWKNEYLKDEFVVNATLSKCTQKKDLGDVIKNLKYYALELHESMTDILKEETDDIITLAQGLSNLTVQINKLTVPIMQFREEILALFELIIFMERFCKEHVEQSKNVNLEQHHESLKFSMNKILSYVEGIVEKQIEDSSIDYKLYERAIDEYSINVNHLEESKKSSADSVVNSSLAHKLKILTDDKFVKSLKNQDAEPIYCCLRSYVSLNRQADAEDIYNKTIVEPALTKIFSAKNLEENNGNLEDVYDEAIKFLDKDMKILLQILKRYGDLRGYNFVLNTFWNTSDRLLRENLPQTTASGNPDLFQKRYYHTWIFLTLIKARLHRSQRNHESFQEHMKRFNLAVYFEIRHQQICASFERDLIQPVTVSVIWLPGDPQFKLKASKALWRSVNCCFHPNIYLNQLCDQFVRLSMMLVSRYVRYINDTAKAPMKEMSTEEFLIICMLDINMQKELLGQAIKVSYVSFLQNPQYIDMYRLLEKAVDIYNKAFDKTYNDVITQLVNINVEKGKTLLQQVGSIPRLYRRTNKSAPKEPSGYVLDIVKPITEFHTSYSHVLKEDIGKITDSSINKIAEQYLTVIQDVLHSICKTEESLRRLKSRNIPAADEATQTVDLTSDEAKIKEQIRIDVAYFLSKLMQLVVDPENQTLKDLKKESGCSS